MSFMPVMNLVSGADWGDLAAEFDCWREAGSIAPLWWRDDDASRPTRQFETLLRFADGIPLAIAAIPALAEAALADFLEPMPSIAVVAHGWRHENHAASGKKSEYPPGRPAAEVTAEIGAGRERLARLFGDRALPVFVPPWNRFDAEYVPLLAENGIVGLSGMASRGPPAPAGIAAADVHIDLCAWRSGRKFIGEAAALGHLVAGLKAMRAGTLAAPAIGILTHHAVMDDGTAAFLGRLNAAVADHPAVRWASLGELLP